MKKRMVAGYNLSQDGVIAPGEPIKGHVDLPNNSKMLCMRIDPRGNFVLFAEVWSHPEGTKINFEQHDFTLLPPGREVPPGSWEWFDTLSAGPAIFHIYRRADPKIEVAS